MKYVTRRNYGLPSMSLFDAMLRDWNLYPTDSLRWTSPKRRRHIS